MNYFVLPIWRYIEDFLKTLVMVTLQNFHMLLISCPCFIATHQGRDDNSLVVKNFGLSLDVSIIEDMVIGEAQRQHRQILSDVECCHLCLFFVGKMATQ